MKTWKCNEVYGELCDLMAEGVRLESNGFLIWSIQKPTWERDWDPTRLLMMQGNFPRRSFASGSSEGEQLATLDLTGC
jgi:hypothetical protein